MEGTHFLFLLTFQLMCAALAILSECSVAAAVAPLSDCYSLDKENYLFDFVSFLPVLFGKYNLWPVEKVYMTSKHF